MLLSVEVENYYIRQNAMDFWVTITIVAIIFAQPHWADYFAIFWDDKPLPTIIFDGCHTSSSDASLKPI